MVTLIQVDIEVMGWKKKHLVCQRVWGCSSNHSYGKGKKEWHSLSQWEL